MKKALRSNGDAWEVTQEDTYYINNGNFLLTTVDLGYIGDFYFSQEDGGAVAFTEGGTWTPAAGNSANNLYQVFTDDNDDMTVTIAIYYWVTDACISDGGNTILSDYSKGNMIGENNEDINDTIIKSSCHLVT
ncbi:MAG: hypothetical protein ACI9O4_001933 [Chitinophagales bacterium]